MQTKQLTALATLLLESDEKTLLGTNAVAVMEKHFYPLYISPTIGMELDVYGHHAKIIRVIIDDTGVIEIIAQLTIESEEITLKELIKKLKELGWHEDLSES